MVWTVTVTSNEGILIMATQKNGSTPAARPVQNTMTEAEWLDRIAAYGEAEGTGSASWERVAYDIMQAVEQGVWKKANFESNAAGKADVADRIISGFYDRAVKANRKLIRPAPNTLKSRVSNLRAIGKAADLHGEEFRNQLDGDGKILGPNGALERAIAKKEGKLFGAFEIIYRVAVELNKKGVVQGYKLTPAEVKKAIVRPETEEKDELAKLVDAIGTMVTTLHHALNGYDTGSKDKKEHHEPIVTGDKVLTDIHTKMAAWHKANASKGTRKVKPETVTLDDVSKAQLQKMLREITAREKADKNVGATA